MTAHEPKLPTWDCNGCGAPFPCPTRQRELLALYLEDLDALLLHMYDQHRRAAADLYVWAAGPLIDRFTAWIVPLNAPVQLRADDIQPRAGVLDFSGTSRAAHTPAGRHREDHHR